jgi:polar amino acid transport system substrate-binding protein
MDQPGVRIAVPRADASDLRLTQLLKHAELVRIDSIADAIDMVHAGTIDAYAAPRTILLALSSKAPGSRVLDDGFANIVWVAMVPKGETGHLAYVSDFLQEAKLTGLLKQTIERANLSGLQVVPPDKPR